MGAEGLTCVRPGEPPVVVSVEPYPADRGAPECAISRDGKWLALVTASYGLMVRSLLSEERLTVGEPYAEERGQRGPMAWSADGETLAFVEEGKLAAWNRTAGRRELVSTPRVTDLAWSPDGKLIAFGRRDTKEQDLGLWLVATSGGEPKRLAPPSGDIFAASWPVFSPDGQWIAFWHAWEGGALCFVKADGTGYRKDVDFGGAPMVWRRDGSALVYLSLKDEMTARGIYQCSPSGKPVALMQGDTDQFDMLLSGELVWLQSAERKDEMTTKVAVRYLPAGALRADKPWQVVMAGSHGRCQFRPDGRQLAVWIGRDDGKGDLYVGPPGQELRQIASGLGDYVGWVQCPSVAAALTGGKP